MAGTTNDLYPLFEAAARADVLLINANATTKAPDMRPGESWSSYAERCDYDLCPAGPKQNARHAVLPKQLTRQSPRPR